MKTKQLLIISLLTFSLYNCSSNDHRLEPTTNVEGVWKITSFLMENDYDFNNDGVASKDLIIEMETYDCFQDATYLFMANGSVTFNLKDFPNDIDLLLNPTTGEYEYNTICMQIDPRFMTWTQSGNSINILDIDIAVTGTISESTMTFEIEGYGVEVLQNNEVTVTTEKVIMVLTKL